MYFNKCLDQASKAADNAVKNGEVEIDGMTYTLVFKPLEWHYTVTDSDGNFIVNFNTKKITQAKKWLREYFAN
jgi:hypothetical protein